MSREEAKEELQKFKALELIREVEVRRKLLSQAKSTRDFGIQLGLSIVIFFAFLIVYLLKIDRAETLIFLALFFLLFNVIEVGMIKRRIDALIELIGEEDLLKKS